MSSEFIDIILFGLIAIFLVYRLRSILGSTDGKIVNLKTKKTQTKFKPKIVPKNDNVEFLKGADKAYEMIVFLSQIPILRQPLKFHYSQHYSVQSQI